MPILIIPIVWTVSGFVVSRAKGLRIAAVVLCTIKPQPVDALVKGNAPPPKKGPPAEERKRWNLEECQKQAERGADKAEKGARANMVRASVTSKGARYRVLVDAKQPSHRRFERCHHWQAVGSVRRFTATPQMGWDKATRECDEGFGRGGNGGELKTTENGLSI
eukprot:scaffold3144_cov290-Chaetoceros_neogracile.AAC.3